MSRRDDLLVVSISHPLRRQLPTTTRGGLMIAWTCTTCMFPIADSEGVVAVPLRQISDMPMFGPEWEPRHLLCAEDMGDYYGIDVEQLRSHEDVLRWTAHLLGKAWLANSNWDEIIRSTVKEAETACG